MKNGVGVTALALVLVAASAGSAQAQSADGMSRLRDTFKREPRASAVVKMALAYYQVAPNTVQSLRSSARSRALLPVMSGGIAYATLGTAQASSQSLTDPNRAVLNLASNTLNYSAALTWDFRELIFNPAEIQAYSVVPIQREIALEVTRSYFLRRQLQIRLALKPPTDPIALSTLELRVEEYSALLNALTGGAFSQGDKQPDE